MSVNLENMKFNENDFAGKDIASLPDRPSDRGMSAQELKERFDLVPKILIAMGKFNELIDALHKSGAEAIGIKDLLEKIKNDIIALEQVESARAAAEIARVEAELARVQAEIARVEAEARRTEAETLRVSAEDGRLNAEDARGGNEVDRQYEEEHRRRAEVVRGKAEEGRSNAEDQRNRQEIVRNGSENDRNRAEQLRQERERGRAEAETRRQKQVEQLTQTVNEAKSTVEGYQASEGARNQAEDVRVQNETARQQAEEARVGAETARENAEGSRVVLDNERTAKESERVIADNARTEAESARRTAEEARVRAEQGRVNAEGTREEERLNFRVKGNWQNGPYKRHNIVLHQGKAYIAGSDTTNEPPHSDWALLATKGEDGKSLRIGGKYDSLSALQSAHPQGNGNLYVVDGKLYAWLDRWEAVGDLVGGGIDKAQILEMISPELDKKVDLYDPAWSKTNQVVEGAYRGAKSAWADLGLATNDGEPEPDIALNAVLSILGEHVGVIKSVGISKAEYALLKEFYRQNEASYGLKGESLFERIDLLLEQYEEGAFGKVEVVNDLTTGGIDKALSAEQGKVLFQSVVDGKKKIATAINDKMGRAVANENMTHEVLSRYIKDLRHIDGSTLDKVVVELARLKGDYFFNLYEGNVRIQEGMYLDVEQLNLSRGIYKIFPDDTIEEVVFNSPNVYKVNSSLFFVNTDAPVYMYCRGPRNSTARLMRADF